MGQSIKIRCPNLRCRTILSVAAGLRGECVRCEACGQNLVVPFDRKAGRPSAQGKPATSGKLAPAART